MSKKQRKKDFFYNSDFSKPSFFDSIFFGWAIVFLQFLAGGTVFYFWQGWQMVVIYVSSILIYIFFLDLSMAKNRLKDKQKKKEFEDKIKEHSTVKDLTDPYKRLNKIGL